MRLADQSRKRTTKKTLFDTAPPDPGLRFQRMKRSVSLLVSDRVTAGQGAIVEGIYQSPILVQWHHGVRQARVLDVTLTRFISSARS